MPKRVNSKRAKQNKNVKRRRSTRLASNEIADTPVINETNSKEVNVNVDESHENEQKQEGENVQQGRKEEDPEYLNDIHQQLSNNEMKVQFFEAVVGYLTSFPAKDFFNEIIKNEIEESSKNNEIIFGALFRALEESARNSRNSQNAKEFKKPDNYFEFTMCEDRQFHEMVHITRKTAKTLIEKVRGIPVELDYNPATSVSGLTPNNEPIDKIIFLVLWYLRNKDSQLEESVNIFDLGTVENARKLLSRGFTLLSKLKADAGILWPSAEELMVTSTLLDRRFSFPKVAGIMSHRLITCENGQRLMLQAVCNEKGMFVDTCASFDTRPGVVFKQSMLQNKFQELSPGLSIVSDEFILSEKSKKNIMFPYKEEGGGIELNTEQQLFNIMHEFVMGIINQAFIQLFLRFPRLNSLDRCEPEILTAACVLHNYCVKLKDLTPL